MAPAPLSTLFIGDWASCRSDAMSVRQAVFIDEQGIPAHEEWDEADALAIHAVVHDAQGQPLATGRLISDGMPLGSAKIGRMAVLPAHRGTGLGRSVLQGLMAEAQSRGWLHVALHAQSAAKAFYENSGFEPEGAEFDEVGIPHQRMVIRL